MSPFLLIILSISLFEVAGNVTAKLWSLHKHPSAFISTILFYGIAGGLFARSLKYEGMAIANILWISLSVILATILGYFVFKEDISLLQLAGIGIITVGLIMITI